ncbi:MAG: DUF4159 domain-containing protein [Bacteroidetes bacterium]|jgi:hypothetical protein|nr:DUF4159 domain-containing protein [Flavobacteriaceae bacterium]MDA0719754.1 DUF4159 domain-containing protein [Bacteroidota bacterium]MDA0864222.1 DUF4159 domain-containing protein [Bacteroidota bacterium]MDA1210452.1 DUF4159 domain-containing protein [Bacteroidota bacterium]HCK06114.1 hypothetical protein [Flavobacteriaceae bacterium]
MKHFLFLLASLLISTGIQSQTLGVLKYSGGGDWYSNPTALPQLIEFCNEHLGTTLEPQIKTVSLDSDALFDLPWIHMTGHGNVFFSESEIETLKAYLLGGGFLHIDDNYGMDSYIRPILSGLFSEAPLIELPTTHPIFTEFYKFPEGLPKIHAHDNKPPQAFGIILEGRLALLYTYESDLSDGWEDPRVHNDPEQVREKALQMGANMIHYVFSH